MKQSPALSSIVGRGGRFFKEVKPKKSSSRSLYCKSKAADRVRRLRVDRREVFMPYEDVGTVCEGMPIVPTEDIEADNHSQDESRKKRLTRCMERAMGGRVTS
jgi:hypothetical protein